jgi:5-methylthioadenosine/S-adenosylhomocysteine deaminase
MRVLIRNGYILSLDAHDTVYEHGDILIEGTKIVDIGNNLDPGKLNPDQVIDATNKLVMPGMVNADLHAAEVFSKGLFENQPLELRLEDRNENAGFGQLSSEMVYASALQAGIQALKTGVTTVQDHWRFSPSFAKEGIRAVLNAYRILGLRSILAIEIDASQLPWKPLYYEEDFPLSLLPKDREEPIISRVGHVINAFEDALDNNQNTVGRLSQITISPPEQLLTNPRFAKWLTEIAVNKKNPVHLHLNQSKFQVINSRNGYQGQTAIQWVDDLGLLTQRTSISHTIWITPAEIELFSIRGVSVIHTPLSDLYTGAGVIPLHTLIEAGVKVALGTGEGCGGNLNLFDALKMTASIHRIVQPDYHHWVSVEQSLAMATHGSARACQLENKAGQISINSNADLVLYNLDGFSFSPFNNPKDQFVCLENGSSIDTVIINGNVVVRDREITSIDETTELNNFRELFHNRNEINDSDNCQKTDLKAYLKNTYEKNVLEAFPIRRWADNPVIDSRLKQVFKKRDE